MYIKNLKHTQNCFLGMYAFIFIQINLCNLLVLMYINHIYNLYSCKQLNFVNILSFKQIYQIWQNRILFRTQKLLLQVNYK